MNHHGWIKWLVIGESSESQQELKVGRLLNQKNSFLVADPQPLLEIESAKGHWNRHRCCSCGGIAIGGIGILKIFPGQQAPEVNPTIVEVKVTAEWQKEFFD
jgi:hypothetical protein